MKNYLICYFILRQCLFETLEDDLSELLKEISPELWENQNGKPENMIVYEQWKNVIDSGKMSADDVRSSIISALECCGLSLEKTISHLKNADMSYYLSTASEMADELLNEWSV